MKKVFKNGWLYISIAIFFSIILNSLSIDPRPIRFCIPQTLYYSYENYAVTYFDGIAMLINLTIFLTLIIHGVAWLFKKGYSVKRRIFMFVMNLMVVVLVLGMILPNFGRARERGRRMYCVTCLRQIHNNLEMYAEDNEHFFPPNLDILIEYSPSIKNLLEPHYTHRHKDDNAFPYEYYGTNKKSTDEPFLILEDKFENHFGSYYNQMFSDGKVLSLYK